MKSTKEVRPSFVTFILKSDAQRQTPFQGGNAMSMTTNGIGNNPAMDSRAAYDYAAAMQKAHIETAATSEVNLFTKVNPSKTRGMCVCVCLCVYL